MRDITIDTAALTDFNSAVDEAVDSEKSFSGFLLAHGQAGRGKTEAATTYHCNRGGAYLRVMTGWTPTAFLQRLLFEVRGKNSADYPRSNGARCKDEIMRLLDAKKMPIFVDEADRLKIEHIEHLRDILDVMNVPVVLIGEEALYGLLTERRRIWSRVIQEVEFGPINGDEVGIYAYQAAGLDIPGELCIKIAKKAEGDFRLVRNMMLLLERAAKAADTLKVDKDILDSVFSIRSWRRA